MNPALIESVIGCLLHDIGKPVPYTVEFPRDAIVTIILEPSDDA